MIAGQTENQILRQICQTLWATPQQLSDNQQEVQLLRLWLSLLNSQAP